MKKEKKMNAALVIDNSKKFSEDIWQYAEDFTEKQWKQAFHGFAEVVQDVYDFLCEKHEEDYPPDKLYKIGDVANMLRSIDVKTSSTDESKIQNIPKEIKKKLQVDIDELLKMDSTTSLLWDEKEQQRRLTLEELAKVIKAGQSDLEIILGQDHCYYLYSNTLDAYCPMDYKGWKQEESFIQELVNRGEHLFPLMTWYFGEIEI